MFIQGGSSATVLAERITFKMLIQKVRTSVLIVVTLNLCIKL